MLWAVVGEALNSHKKSINGSRILIIGLAYKPNVGDERESPSFTFLEELTAKGATVDYYDPYVPEIGPTREHVEWAGKRSIEWTKAQLRTYDAALISTNHDCIDYQQLADWLPLVVDTRNALPHIDSTPNQVWRA